MDSKIFLIAALALALGACSNDNTPEAPADGQVAARITAEIGSVSSRATGTSWVAGDIIGISTSGDTKTVYNNVPYRHDGTGFTVNGTTIYFQDTKTVNFSAYYPYMTTDRMTGGVIKASTAASSQGKDSQSQIDFLFASGATADKDNPTVAFTGNNAFRHMMSRITLRLKEGDDVTFAGKLTGYTLQGIALDGTFNTADGKTTVDGTAGSLEMSLQNVNAQSGLYETAPVILFPQTDVALKLELTLSGETYRTTLPVTGLEAGNNYIFPVTVNKRGLTVGSAEIIDWNKVESDDSEAKM